MRAALRVTFSVVTILLSAAVILQLYFAGVGVFSDPADHLFDIHGWNGRVVLPVLVLLTVLLAALARAGKRTIWLSVLLIGLLILQTLIFIVTGLIFNVGPDHTNPPLGATLMVSLHPINGLAILWVSLIVARRAWRLAYGPGPRRTPAEDAPLPETESTDAAPAVALAPMLADRANPAPPATQA